MLRFLLITLMLASASPSALAQPTAPHCAVTASRAIAFTGAAARDVLDVTATGPDCTRVVVTVSVRTANGSPVLAFAAPLADLPGASRLPGQVKPHTLFQFLRSYADGAQIDVGAAQLPEWKPGEPSPGFSDGLELSSPLDPTSYKTLRAARPTMLCISDGEQSGACYVWSRESQHGILILRRES